jgi:hypothetical protein
MEVALKEGKYIYCIIESNQYESFGPIGIGDRGDELYTICFNDIAAAVSNSPIKKYAVSRENTLAHEKAIEEVMKEHTVLPVRFATIAEDEDTVKKILEREYNAFKDLLNKFEDKKELGLKSVFKEAIYKEILEKYEDIKSLKKMIENLPSDKTYFQRMEIGRMVEKALEKEKEIYKEKILSILTPLADDIKINALYGERMVVNAAFLVSKDKEAEFDAKIHELDAGYGNIIKFKYVGTIPPFNFVNLIIETGRY